MWAVPECVCMCVHRVYRMVEVLSARLQDMYTKWENRSEPRLLNQTNTHHLSYGQLRRHGYQERHRKRALAREVTREVRMQTLLTWFHQSVTENLENLHSSAVVLGEKNVLVSLHACQAKPTETALEFNLCVWYQKSGPNCHNCSAEALLIYCLYCETQK